jgi:hypothetical protein
MATELPPEQDNERLFEDIDAYPWDSDTEFQVSGSTVYVWIIIEDHDRADLPPSLAPMQAPHLLKLRS